MRVVRWLSAALVAVIVSSTAVAAQAAPSTPTAPYTALTMQVTADPDLSFGGGSGAYAYADDEVVVSSFYSTFVNIDGGTDPTGDTGIGFVLYAKTGGTLTVGTLPIAYNANNSAGGLTLSIAHGACQASAGNVDISAISFADGAHQLTADYDVTCNGQPYSGSVRLASPTGYHAAVLTPGTTRLGNVDIGEHRDLTYTLTERGTATTPVAVGKVALTTSTAASFTTTADTCSGASLSYGASCVVSVRIAPVAAGPQSLVVTIPTGAGGPYTTAITLTAQDPVAGTYYAMDPQRVLDTRYGIGVRRAPLGAGQTINFYPRGSGGQQASAVVLNLTVTGPSTSGYLTLSASGMPRPRTSSINYTRAQTVANLVTVPVDAVGRVAVYNSAGATAVIADIVGWYAAPSDDTSQQRGGGYHPTLVERIFDTRTAGYGKLPGGYHAQIPVRYQGDGKHIGALSVTVTAANMTGTGYLTTWNGYYDAPGTSTLNYTKASGVVSNAAVVPTSYCPPGATCNANAYIAVQNQGATPVDVIVDINGYYDDGNLPADVRFHALPSPTRIVDTRSKQGTTRFGANTTRTVTAPPRVAGVDTIALDANITAVRPTLRTYLTVWPKFDDYPRPQAAVLNPLRGQTVADHVVAQLGFSNLFNIYNFVGSTDVTMDVGGTFELFPPTPPGTAKRNAPRAVPVPTGNLATAAPAQRAGNSLR